MIRCSSIVRPEGRTDILQRIVRRGDSARVDGQREEAAERAFAPLQVCVQRVLDEQPRNLVGDGRYNMGSEG